MESNNTQDINHIKLVIMSGGSGERLWPLSRGQRPKQLLAFSDNNRSLLIDAISRARMFTDTIEVQVSQENAADIQAHLLRHVPKAMPNITVEPKSCDSGFAFIYQAAKSVLEDPEALLCIVPSDHLVEDSNSYICALKSAIACVQDKPDAICLIGCTPNKAASNFGYILPSTNSYPALVNKFIEKPDTNSAQRLINAGALWNSGIVVAYAQTILACAQDAQTKLTSDQAEIIQAALELRAPTFTGELSHTNKLSFDYILLEHNTNLLVVKSEHRLKDIGSLHALDDVVQPAQAAEAHAHNNKVYSFTNHQKRYALLGTNELRVVDFDDALLIAHSDYIDYSRDMVNALKECYGSTTLHDCLEQERPWGKWKILFEAPGCKIKLIEVDPHKRLSLQSHARRHETWLIISGKALVEIDGKTQTLLPRQSVSICPQQKHRLSAVGDTALTLVEIAQGNYIDEDDIVRYEDDWMRF